MSPVQRRNRECGTQGCRWHPRGAGAAAEFRKDLLPGALETVIDAANTLDDTIQRILRESGLDRVLPIDRWRRL
ncbi:hypothetical protein [Streptomyces sp. NPDC057694]|uniref:hypothetical protein n=1 Tax=Streptomyces sp. NPDC057694 TaxID=3346216 RepID=UPI0036A72BB7